MPRSIITTSILFVLVALTSQASAAAPNCATPRGAADVPFYWQTPPRAQLASAASCFEAKGRSPKQLQRMAVRLRAVYNNAGAIIRVAELSDNRDYVGSNGQQRVVPHSDFGDIVIERTGKRWLWTAASLDRVDHHYAKIAKFDSLIERIPAPLKGTMFDVAYWQYLALLLLAAFGLVVRRLLQAVVAARVRSVGEKLGQGWATKVVDVIDAPGATLVTAIILRLGYPRLHLPLNVAAMLSTVVQVLVTFSLFWAGYRAVELVGAKLAQRAESTESKLDDQLVPLVRKSLKIIVFVLGVLVLLQNVGINVTAMVAGLSIGGLAVGLAAKDTLANFFGSISIFVDSPFQIGDWIKVDGTDGTVEEVGFRSTRLRTFYNSVVVMPNSRLADAKIDNFGRREFRRCFLTLGLTYDTTTEQMQAFVEGLRAIIQANDFTRKDSFEVHMAGFGASSLDVMLYFFFRCDTWTDELRERHNVFLEIMRLADDLGVSFAFPTQSLHVESAAVAREKPPIDVPNAKALAQIVHDYAPEGARARVDGPQITKEKYVPNGQVGRGPSADDSQAGEG